MTRFNKYLFLNETKPSQHSIRRLFQWHSCIFLLVFGSLYCRASGAVRRKRLWPGFGLFPLWWSHKSVKSSREPKPDRNNKVPNQGYTAQEKLPSDQLYFFCYERDCHFEDHFLKAQFLAKKLFQSLSALIIYLDVFFFLHMVTWMQINVHANYWTCKGLVLPLWGQKWPKISYFRIDLDLLEPGEGYHNF